MYVCMYVCMYVHTYRQTLIHTYTYIHRMYMYVLYWLNWLKFAVGDCKRPRLLGQKFKCGRATYIIFFEQGTNIQLPLSAECQFCPSSKLK